ncbi:hypothetical protein HGP14_14710 [Rhizobium sp. P32RR-XVIII]|uniref:hypothetical protein n=1 Tax=Rhizobium sp. P32RR-XVIII TaxID=2726738 RepID=UPI0014569639|nr:hypothetical protein [Rhizobium sp. P32RR-XVIII]NLS04607.1 hypothetical protein [Rhizobium sp. P32RR-XVIII]
MKLAEEILITLAGQAIELRPSLRHAILLERRDGSFRKLLDDIRDGSLTAALDIVEPHAGGMLFLKNHVFEVMAEVRPTLIAYVLACAGLDVGGEETDAPASSERGATSRSFADHLLDLYKTGTGWLGWTPETTLYATPTEIRLAYEGHIEMLKIVHGSGAEAQPKDDRPIADKFRAIFADLGTQKVEG